MKNRTVICRNCLKEFNRVFAKCPFCGALRTDREEKLKEIPLCPRCGVPLHHAHIRDNDVSICRTCRGMWLDTDVFQYLASRRDVYQDAGVPKSFDKKPLMKTDENSMYVPCPKCGTVMNRKNFKRISGIVIDICPKHGVWLDRGELEQIRSFVANVDTEEMLEKEIRLNEEELKSLKRQLKDTDLVQLATEFWNLKYWLYRKRR